MRGIVASLLAALVLTASAGAAPTTSGDRVQIDAILSQTGPAAFLGQTETKSLAVLEGVVNAQGGINGRLVHFVVSDDGSAPPTAVQIFNQINAHHPAAIIGTGFTATCNANKPLVKEHGPVMYCLSPSMAPEPGGYGFAGSV
jgi:branched-chain amino acid transport system substrate-binding protein